MKLDFYNMLLEIDKLFKSKTHYLNNNNNNNNNNNKYKQYISSKRDIDGYMQTIVYRANNNPETKYSIEIIRPDYIWCSIPIKNSNYLYRTIFNHEEYNINRVYEYLKLHIE